MSQRQRLEALGKLMAYILAYRPDEYGLLPDEEGFVSLKALRQAIGEEEGWGFVRESHLQEIALTDPKKRFEIRDGRIRATFKEAPALPGERVDPPKILYYSCRRRAYPVILKRGLLPEGYPWVVLAESRELAERMGKRRDPQPLVLEVHAKRASAGTRHGPAGRSRAMKSACPKRRPVPTRCRSASTSNTGMNGSRFISRASSLTR